MPGQPVHPWSSHRWLRSCSSLTWQCSSDDTVSARWLTITSETGFLGIRQLVHLGQHYQFRLAGALQNLTWLQFSTSSSTLRTQRKRPTQVYDKHLLKYTNEKRHHCFSLLQEHSSCLSSCSIFSCSDVAFLSCHPPSCFHIQQATSGRPCFSWQTQVPKDQRPVYSQETLVAW